ncbi:MAG: TetR family transcriptional regulator [bacterium]|nr:TetR family transcriptional regulator [bacterium]
MKKTKEDAALTRNAVLAAATEVFARKGYARTSLVEVAKEAGMTRGAIYWHFSNKHQLLSAVINECDARLEARIDKILDTEKSPLTRTKKLITEFILIIIGEKEFRLMEEIMVFKNSPEVELQELYHIHMENIKEYRELIADLIHEGIEAGEFSQRLNVETVVVAMTTFIAGIKTAWLSDIICTSPEGFSLEEKAGELAELFIYGIAKEK